MDNAAINALIAQQMQTGQPSQNAAVIPEGETNTAQLLAQEQALEPQLRGNQATGSPDASALPQEISAANVLPRQDQTEEEDPTEKRVIPKAKKPEENNKAPQLEDMILVGMLGQPQAKATVKSPLKNLDEEQLKRIIMQGDNSAGIFNPSESSILEETKLKALHEKIADNAKIKKSGEAKTLGKYETQFQEDILKNPQNYKLNTPRGEMSLQECMRNGYDPETQTFGESPKQMLERHIQNLPPQEQDAIRKLVDTQNLSLDPSDVESRGIAASPEMLAQQVENLQGGTPPSETPNDIPIEGGTN